MAKKDDINPKEAQEIVKKFCEPPYNADQIRLREDVRLIIKGEGGGYEEEDEDEEEEDNSQPKSSSDKSGGSEAAASERRSPSPRSERRARTCRSRLRNA